MSERKNPKCEFCGDPAYMNDNGAWKCKPRIKSQIAKKDAEAYCKANGLVMMPEEPFHDALNILKKVRDGELGNCNAYRDLIAAFRVQGL